MSWVHHNHNDGRDLPHGWSRQWDSNSRAWVYVDQTVQPHRTSWVPPPPPPQRAFTAPAGPPPGRMFTAPAGPPPGREFSAPAGPPPSRAYAAPQGPPPVPQNTYAYENQAARWGSNAQTARSQQGGGYGEIRRSPSPDQYDSGPGHYDNAALGNRQRRDPDGYQQGPRWPQQQQQQQQQQRSDAQQPEHPAAKQKHSQTRQRVELATAAVGLTAGLVTLGTRTDGLVQQVQYGGSTDDADGGLNDDGGQWDDQDALGGGFDGY